MVNTTTEELAPPALLHRVSWGAIFAGTLVAIATTALFGLLGLGIGFGTYDPAQGDSAAGIPKATLAWWAITTILAMGLGGFVAARLAGIPRSFTGALHGLSVWSLSLLLTLWLATSAVGTVLGAATSIVSTATRMTTGVVATAGGAVIDLGGQAAPSGGTVEDALREQGITRDRIRQEVNQLTRSAGLDRSDLSAAQNAIGTAAANIARQPGTAGQQIDRLVDKLFNNPDAALSPQERNQLVDELAVRSGLSREEASRIAGRWETQANAAAERVRTFGGSAATSAGDTAVRVADDAMSILSKVAWGMFLVSLAGLVAALVGAALGAPGLMMVRREGRTYDAAEA